MRTKLTRKCPLCKGSGKIIMIIKSFLDPKIRRKARKLYAKGVSLREIGKQIGIKHAQSVKHLILSKII